MGRIAVVSLKEGSPGAWRWLQEQLAACWCVPDATPERAAADRGRQIQAVAQHLPAAGIASVLLAFATVLTFWKVVGGALLVPWAAWC